MKAMPVLLGATALFLIATLTAEPVVAASPAEAEKLKSAELTPFGAERAGNAAGTIPAWDGGYTTVPPGYQTGQPRPDPFASEKPVLTINAKNMAEFADKLSAGTKALMAKYPDYRIDVYPTHRTAAAPKWVYDNTFKNATTASTTDNGYAVKGAYAGIPFPIPKDGAEAMWNHILRWRGEAQLFPFRSYIIDADGQVVLASQAVDYFSYPYYYHDRPVDSWNGDAAFSYQVTEAPPFKAGETILLRDPVDWANKGRQAWQYLVGQRRVRRAPNLAYDTPNPVNSGADLFDEPFVFFGAMDKYTWKLVGKKEMYIPYNVNGFFLHKDHEVVGAHFFNPDFVRWELHRVWVVEANLAPDQRHVLPHRFFYLDEDSWAAVLADSYDAQGQLAHHGFGLPFNVYELPGVCQEEFGTYDLLKGSYSATIWNEMPVQFKLVPPWPDQMFTPEYVAAKGVR